MTEKFMVAPFSVIAMAGGDGMIQSIDIIFF